MSPSDETKSRGRPLTPADFRALLDRAKDPACSFVEGNMRAQEFQLEYQPRAELFTELWEYVAQHAAKGSRLAEILDKLAAAP